MHEVHWHYSVEQRQTNHKFTNAQIKIPQNHKQTQ